MKTKADCINILNHIQRSSNLVKPLEGNFVTFSNRSRCSFNLIYPFSNYCSWHCLLRINDWRYRLRNDQTVGGRKYKGRSLVKERNFSPRNIFTEVSKTLIYGLALQGNCNADICLCCTYYFSSNYFLGFTTTSYGNGFFQRAHWFILTHKPDL